MTSAMTRFVTFALTVLTTTAAFACPLCKDSVPGSDAQSAAAVPSGFNTSIYLMLGSLFCVIGMVTWTLVKGARSVAPRSGFPIKRPPLD